MNCYYQFEKCLQEKCPWWLVDMCSLEGFDLEILQVTEE